MREDKSSHVDADFSYVRIRLQVSLREMSGWKREGKERDTRVCKSNIGKTQKAREKRDAPRLSGAPGPFDL